MMKTVILTAFQPFGSDTVNPTEKLLERVPDFLYDTKIIKVTLPVVYGHAFERLLPLIEQHKPVLILELGLAKGRSHINIERVAINVNDSIAKDNLGNIKYEDRIEPSGPDGIFTNLPLKVLREKAVNQHLPVQISNTAGAYVCNNLFYKTLHHVKTFNMDTKVGFIHIPATPEMVSAQPNVPSMSINVMTDALMTVLDVVLNPINTLDLAQKVPKGKKAL